MDPFPAWMERLWDSWDVRVMVLFSLILQIVLIILGSRRRYVTGLWIRVVVWSAYLMADWVAIVALSKLTDIDTEGDSENNNNDCKQSNNDSFNPHHVIRVLWAPLLLLHLGGPDTVTAYSMEDARLWLRHALGLAVQVSVAIYVFLRFWTGSWLSILTFPMFMTGITKYGERVWVLRSTNNERPQNYDLYNEFKDTERIKDIPGLQLLSRGYICFHNFKPHIANYVRTSSEMTQVGLATKDNSTENAFQVIDFELGFMYDVLYTKASIIYTRVGCILRSISFFCTVSVLLGFALITKDKYSNVDMFITYVLLVGAVVLDIYAVTLILYSDWAILWMTKHHEKPLVTQILRVLAPLSLKWKRWSNSMAQFNLLSFCVYKDEKTPFRRILRFFGVDQKFKEYRCQTRVNISKDFKQLMADQIREIFPNFDDVQPFNKRGEWTLERHGLGELIKWSTEQDFDKSIVIWHIATNICYYSDPTSSEDDKKKLTTNLVSNYMMYLLVKHPYMLPITTWHFMFKYTCTSIVNKFKRTGSSLTNEANACETLLKEENLGVGEVSHQQRPALVIARRLIEHPDKWKILSGVWTEMLCYAATQCQVDHHAQELRRGGEFLTHVWLFLTNLFFTERINKPDSPVQRATT